MNPLGSCPKDLTTPVSGPSTCRASNSSTASANSGWSPSKSRCTRFARAIFGPQPRHQHGHNEVSEWDALGTPPSYGHSVNLDSARMSSVLPGPLGHLGLLWQVFQ